MILKWLLSWFQKELEVEYEEFRWKSTPETEKSIQNWLDDRREGRPRGYTKE